MSTADIIVMLSSANDTHRGEIKQLQAWQPKESTQKTRKQHELKKLRALISINEQRMLRHGSRDPGVEGFPGKPHK